MPSASVAFLRSGVCGVTGCTSSLLARLFVHAMFDEEDGGDCFLQDDWQDEEDRFTKASDAYARDGSLPHECVFTELSKRMSIIQNVSRFPLNVYNGWKNVAALVATWSDRDMWEACVKKELSELALLASNTTGGTCNGMFTCQHIAATDYMLCMVFFHFQQGAVVHRTMRTRVWSMLPRRSKQMVSGEKFVRASDHAVTVNRLSGSVVADSVDDVLVHCTSGGQKRPLTAEQLLTIDKNREEAEAKRQKKKMQGTFVIIIVRVFVESVWFFGQSV